MFFFFSNQSDVRLVFLLISVEFAAHIFSLVFFNSMHSF